MITSTPLDSSASPEDHVLIRPDIPPVRVTRFPHPGVCVRDIARVVGKSRDYMTVLLRRVAPGFTVVAKTQPQKGVPGRPANIVDQASVMALMDHALAQGWDNAQLTKSAIENYFG